jgi:hypothetical protein
MDEMALGHCEGLLYSLVLQRQVAKIQHETKILVALANLF